MKKCCLFLLLLCSACFDRTGQDHPIEYLSNMLDPPKPTDLPDSSNCTAPTIGDMGDVDWSKLRGSNDQGSDWQVLDQDPQMMHGLKVVWMNIVQADFSILSPVSMSKATYSFVVTYKKPVLDLGRIFVATTMNVPDSGSTASVDTWANTKVTNWIELPASSSAFEQPVEAGQRLAFRFLRTGGMAITAEPYVTISNLCYRVVKR